MMMKQALHKIRKPAMGRTPANRHNKQRFGRSRRMRLFLAGLVAVAILFCSGLAWRLLPARRAASTPLNLLETSDWTRVAGVTPQPEGLTITGLGRSIAPLEGPVYQANPPVNITGRHLQTKGDFGISGSLKGPANEASIQLYSSVPRVYDEWRYEPPSWRVTFNESSVEVNVWDGSSSRPASTNTFGAAVPPGASFSLERHGNQGVVSINGLKVGSVSLKELPRGGEYWLGLDAPYGINWQLGSLQAYPVNGSAVQFKDNATKNLGVVSTSLKAEAGTLPHPPLIGAAISFDALFSNQLYANIAFSQFTSFTTENALKPQFVHPQPNTYAFVEADALVDEAFQRGLQIHGHTLVFGEANPDWMVRSPLAGRQKIMTDHIAAVTGHYKGKIATWDVINEPLADEVTSSSANPFRQHIWYQAMGDTYIATALKAAHEADPSAKLYINEYGLEASGPRWDAMLALVTKLKKANVPLDGVGFQAHVFDDGDEINSDELAAHMAALAKIGLSARISEIDVHGDDTDIQTSQYATVLQVCLQQPNCTSYTTWGISDAYGSTTQSNSYPLEYGDDLLWDPNYRPKPAYDSLLKLLQRQGE